MTEPIRPFSIMVRFKVSPADQEELMEMVTSMIMEIGPFLASQPGFKGFRSLRSQDGTLVANSLDWASQVDHENAVASPEMEAAGGPLMEWVENGRATLEVETYEIFSRINVS